MNVDEFMNVLILIFSMYFLGAVIGDATRFGYEIFIPPIALTIGFILVVIKSKEDKKHDRNK